MTMRDSTRRTTPPTLAFAVLTMAACADRTPATIASYRGDSVVVNSMRPTPIPVQVRNRAGDAITGATVRWRHVSGETFTVDDSGRVTCSSTGDMRVEAVSEGAKNVVTVLCRPIANVLFAQQLVLRVGERSGDYSMGARDPQGQPVREIAGVATVLDSAVAVLRDGDVVARTIGRTVVQLEAGDCRTSVSVDVEAPVDSSHLVKPFMPYEEALTLAAGELRTWRPSAGLTYVRLFGDSALTARMAFGVFNANCARLRDTHRALSCITTDSSVVAIRQSFGAAAGRVRVRIEQPPPPQRVKRAGGAPSREAENRFCPQRLG